MTRNEALRAIEQTDLWDVIIIGGGATGLGAAVEAASRGYKTVLLEQNDFANATSSRSTKLIHGGVRYLQKAQLSLVRESLRERGFLFRNASHIVHPLKFIMPASSLFSRLFYGAGLKLYDQLSGTLSLGASTLMNKKEAWELLPGIQEEKLAGAIAYYDAQFDDARLAICLARTVWELGGVALNYLQVKEIKPGRLKSVLANCETNREYELRARVIINAAGVFSDMVRKLDAPSSPPLLSLSRGAHLVVDSSVFPGRDALIIPKTQDGRILFAIPWMERVIIGTTDVPVDNPESDPTPSQAELEFLLLEVSRYFKNKIDSGVVRSCFAGLRPLVKPLRQQHTAALSREHAILSSPSGLITIIGGKWTTYRKMGEDVINIAAKTAGLPQKKSCTPSLHLHGWTQEPLRTPAEPEHFKNYGSQIAGLRNLLRQFPALAAKLHPRLPYLEVEVIWGVREEMARTIQDILARRTRALLLDAQAAVECSSRVAALMAAELGRDANWQKNQCQAFKATAEKYMPQATELPR